MISRRCLPLVSLPNETVPVISASMPSSFGERASNSSATRGRPPVMSRVFWPSTGIRASTSPGDRSWPSCIWISEPTWKPIVTEWSVPGIFTSLPVRVEQLDLRAHDLGRAAALRIDHDQRRQAGDFVDLLGDRDAFLDVLELRLAGEFGDDRAGQRIPVGQHGAGLDAAGRP